MTNFFMLLLFMKDQLNRDTVKLGQCNSDEDAINIFRTGIKNEIDSLFTKNEIRSIMFLPSVNSGQMPLTIHVCLFFREDGWVITDLEQ